MTKRQIEEEEAIHRPSKRARPDRPDRLSSLSDELLLRIFSNLPIQPLNTVQLVSHKFANLSTDPQIWKAHYYNRFVRPRAARIRGIRDKDNLQSAENLHFSSKVSKWLDEESLVRKGYATNWKRQYKLRHNWARGSCKVAEIEVADQVTTPPPLVRLHKGLVYTVDAEYGVRVWSTREDRRLLALMPLPATSNGVVSPTALAIDTAEQDLEARQIVVGFEDGSFTIFGFDTTSDTLTALFSHPPSSNGVISAAAYHWPYLTTLSAIHLLSIYKFTKTRGKTRSAATVDPPTLIHSLRSQSITSPYSLSIRPSASHLSITIAYSINAFLNGWTVGIQEVQLNPEDDSIDASRTAIAALPTSSNLTQTQPAFSKPSSLSYAHPYLLLGHPDNTLTLHMVTSTASRITINQGTRLWGHTSGISGVQIEARGKAISISQKGEEVRIWELEGHHRPQVKLINMKSIPVDSTQQSAASHISSKESLDGRHNRSADYSSARRSGYPFSMRTGLGGADDMPAFNRGLVGFDEENVVVLREEFVGRTALRVYDFS